MRSAQIRGPRRVAFKNVSATRRVADFRTQLKARTAELAKEFGQSEFLMPRVSGRNNPHRSGQEFGDRKM
jgi:hypothetical protein